MDVVNRSDLRESDMWMNELQRYCARMPVRRVLVLHFALQAFETQREWRLAKTIQLIDRYDTIAVRGERLLRL